MHILWEELTGGLPDAAQLARLIIRLTAAAVLGGVVGFQRERARKPAGLRTHMLVSIGTAVFILACASAGMTPDGISRIVQGVVTGIGFIGAGAILKPHGSGGVHGLTTAASVWMAAAIGVAVGLGTLGLAILGALFAFVILSMSRHTMLDLAPGTGDHLGN